MIWFYIWLAGFAISWFTVAISENLGPGFRWTDLFDRTVILNSAFWFIYLALAIMYLAIIWILTGISYVDKAIKR